MVLAVDDILGKITRGGDHGRFGDWAGRADKSAVLWSLM
jgi:hypothetical protein